MILDYADEPSGSFLEGLGGTGLGVP